MGWVLMPKFFNHLFAMTSLSFRIIKVIYMYHIKWYRNRSFLLVLVWENFWLKISIPLEPFQTLGFIIENQQSSAYV